MLDGRRVVSLLDGAGRGLEIGHERRRVFADVSICARIPRSMLDGLRRARVHSASDSGENLDDVGIAFALVRSRRCPSAACFFLLMLEDLRQLAVVCPVRPPAIATGWAVELQLLRLPSASGRAVAYGLVEHRKGSRDVAVVLEVRRGLVVAETHGSGVEEPCQCDLKLDRLGIAPRLVAGRVRVKTGFYAPGEAAELGCGGVDGVAHEGWLVCNSFDVGYELVDAADLSEIDQLGVAVRGWPFRPSVPVVERAGMDHVALPAPAMATS